MLTGTLKSLPYRLVWTMSTSKAFTLILSTVIIAIIVVGLINFDLILELWVKAVIATLLIGVLITLARLLFTGK